jgi:hypothetical protein
MPRPKGSKNKTRKPATKQVQVRLSPDELATLRRIDKSAGRAIHALIAQANQPV